jgi:hypothetical protein
MDDQTLQAILDSLPPKLAGRSKLEPYARLITELRRRRRSYREITQVLNERCGLRVGLHTVYSFVRVRSRAKRREGSVTGAPEAQAVGTGKAASRELPNRAAPRPRGAEKVFHYDESEPLRLLPPETTRK